MTAPAVNTPYQIIDDAMHDAGLLQEGEHPNSEQLTSNMRRLNDLINLWQTKGLKLWLQSDQSITLVASTATYTLAPAGSVAMVKPLRVLQGYYLDSSNNRRPLNQLSADEYLRLGKVTNTGAINSYYVRKLATQLSVSFWLTPDATAATGTAHLFLQAQVTNPISLTETMDFPLEWRIALRWGLADEICTGQPQTIMDRCRQRAEMYRTALEDWDVEDASTMFTPDARTQWSGTSSFR